MARAWEFPFSFAKEAIEGFSQIESQKLKEISAAVRIARFADDRAFKKFMSEGRDERSGIERLKEFAKA
ncbi:hypothetical protein [uncultured Campylobacter sp.]|uniref:hypothetical protein n=1 Tax=uncultured Campylobacter sp. TaxID=218934 RepID=UPI002622B8C1|nr:hypothetical protein [uncultured Campylobacter sp.]